MSAGAVVSVEQLIDAVWGADALKRSRASVHTYVSTLRKVIVQGGGQDVIMRGPGGHRLAPDVASIDFDGIVLSVRDGRRALREHRFAIAAKSLGDGLDQWHGTALDGADGDWMSAERDRLSEMRLAAVEDWSAARRPGRSFVSIDDVPTPAAGASPDGPAAAFVDAFVQGWRAPADADELADHFDPWLHADYRFTQPLIRAPGSGRSAFREKFARPIFSLCSDVRGSVESWAHRDGMLFIAFRLDVTVGRRRVRLRVCDQVLLDDGLVAERHTHLDVVPLLSAILRSPRLWWRVARWQCDDMIAKRRQLRTR
ncbi:AfsR/SARP family transcriptional regulator [Amycolatopsis sp. cmx-11-32]|uniref:AfsR/SARP family transcriptional regulator n=1 Tax=Amycolatopsis sp. cmx-11-32 TaxID=2785796 RepID=UPI0039E3B283